jgi:hypothetical protein
MNPLVYLSPAIHWMALLGLRFRLDYIEFVSILRAFGCMAYSTCFFVKAANKWLEAGSLPVRGFEIGRGLLKSMTRYRSIQVGKLPGLRFAVYRQTITMDAASWEDAVRDMTKAFLKAHLHSDRPSAKPKRKQVYKTCLESITSNYENVAELTGNHVLAVAAAIGIAPHWFVHEHTGCPNGKAMKWFCTERGLPAGRPAAGIFADSLKARIELEGLLVAVDRRIGENVICKVKRIVAGSDSKYCDLAYRGQFLYEFRECVLFVHSKGRPFRTVNGSLFSLWAYGGERISTHELAIKLGADAANEGLCLGNEMGKDIPGGFVHPLSSMYKS